MTYALSPVTLLPHKFAQFPCHQTFHVVFPLYQLHGIFKWVLNVFTSLTASHVIDCQVLNKLLSSVSNGTWNQLLHGHFIASFVAVTHHHKLLTLVVAQSSGDEELVIKVELL